MRYVLDARTNQGHAYSRRIEYRGRRAYSATGKEPDVVIFDFQLPNTNSLKLAQKILRRDPDIKILVVTGMKNDLLPIRFLEAGVHGFITN